MRRMSENLVIAKAREDAVSFFLLIVDLLIVVNRILSHIILFMSLMQTTIE